MGSPTDFPQSDQDDDSDGYPPDEMETKRIEEVSERLCSRLRRSFPSMRKPLCRLFANGRWRNENEGG